MPEKGMQFVARKQLLSYEEMLRLVSVLAREGVNKIRLTGGEPFARKDFDYFIIQLAKIKGVDQLFITTNGVLTGQYIPLLQQLGFKGVNLSLDTLKRNKFKEITRRDDFNAVIETLNELLTTSMNIKLNSVVMHGINHHEVPAIAELAQSKKLHVRFIEEMPFNGTDRSNRNTFWSWKEIEQNLLETFPELTQQSSEFGATSTDYYHPNWKGSVGIIPAFSRTFCGQCNRIRITATGQLKTCLYDNGVMDLRELVRSERADAEILNEMKKAFGNRAVNGFEAEKQRNGKEIVDSMATIGG